MKARQKGVATLEAVTRQYTGLHLQKDVALRQSFRGQDLTKEQIRYAAMYVAVLSDIHERQLQQLEDLELMKVFETEMACIPATVWLELSSIPVDREGLKTLALKTRQKMEEATFRVLSLLKDSGYRHLDLSGLPAVNLNSSVQLLKALQAIGLDIESTGDRVISGMQHPVGQVIREYRKHKKLLSTFLDKLPKHINPVTGRIHADFNQQSTWPAGSHAAIPISSNCFGTAASGSYSGAITAARSLRQITARSS
jgi:DNA polymerase-1